MLEPKWLRGLSGLVGAYWGLSGLIGAYLSGLVGAYRGLSGLIETYLSGLICLTLVGMSSLLFLFNKTHFQLKERDSDSSLGIVFDGIRANSEPFTCRMLRR